MDDIAQPMTNVDMSHYLPNSSIIRYSNLKPLYQQGYKLDDLLGSDGSMLLLFELRPRTGHWCLCFKRNNNTIEYFDPYGMIPDDELSFIPKESRHTLNQANTWLLRFLQDSGKKIEYNPYPFQKEAPGVNTCGRQCIARLAFRKLTIDKYHKLIGDYCDAIVAEAIPKIDYT